GAARTPAFLGPSKPIGPFFTQEQAAVLQDQHGWAMVEDAGRGWRKVVASPKPLAIGGVDVVATLVNRGHIVIAAGGGGIPVVRPQRGGGRGGEAGIDKDYGASMLAWTPFAAPLTIPTGADPRLKNFAQTS